MPSHRNSRVRRRRQCRHARAVERRRMRRDDADYDEARLDTETHAGQVAGVPRAGRGDEGGPLTRLWRALFGA